MAEIRDQTIILDVFSNHKPGRQDMNSRILRK